MKTEIVLSQIFILAVVVLIGAIAAKLKIITNNSKDMLSKVIFNISLPLMLFTKFLNLETTPTLIKNGLIVLVTSGLVILIRLVAKLTFPPPPAGKKSLNSLVTQQLYYLYSEPNDGKTVRISWHRVGSF